MAQELTSDDVDKIFGEWMNPDNYHFAKNEVEIPKYESGVSDSPKSESSETRKKEVSPPQEEFPPKRKRGRPPKSPSDVDGGRKKLQVALSEEEEKPSQKRKKTEVTEKRGNGGGNSERVGSGTLKTCDFSMVDGAVQGPLCDRCRNKFFLIYPSCL